ncbi:nuclear protein DGCR14 [Talaromyces proteolyticus]|uniref:Nuclear protein DGCR14 n=1 Tax=Talaromyces proteolyticus TaxID=1131652 RepID=A0AAD4KWS9_9EURO|nr:nuclear protein DGCR14 [Talaromyces proteolyticus]KAH8702613.1 nuclear protein DGCR14 [Talaromyces proteolyticus]
MKHDIAPWPGVKMASAPSQSVAKRHADMALMPPPPPVKKIKRPSTILDEDSYTDALSHIIARDYFPGLLETQSKQELLDALDSKDKAWISRAGKRLSEVMTPRSSRGVSMNMTPNGRNDSDTPITAYGGDTPASVASSVMTSMTNNKERSVDVANLSLTSFQAKYTSEDNESFNRVLDKQNEKKRENYAWMWNGNKILSARQIAHRQREVKRITDRGEAVKDSSNDSKELVLSTDLDARPAAPDTWKTGVQNSLMFSPASVEDNHETPMQKAEASSRAGPKQVVYNNTRMNSVAAGGQDASVPPSPSLSAIKDAIAGRPRPTDSEPGYTGGETPRVNGYAFVDEDEPEEEDDDAMYERLRLLASQGVHTDDLSPNPFNIKENRKREDLHHRMVDRVARKKRAEKAGVLQSSSTSSPSVPRFPSSPMFSRAPGNVTPGRSGKPLTPAAQMLLKKVGNTPRQATSSSRLKNMWTPTPKRAK